MPSGGGLMPYCGGRAVVQVREARCSKVEDRFRIVEANGVLAFLPSPCGAT